MSRIIALVYPFVYLLALPFIVYRLIRSPGHAQLSQRFGFGLGEPQRHSIWLHASSVGEVMLLEPLIAALEEEYPDAPVLVTAFTATGVATARQRFPRHRVFASPFDFGLCVQRFVDRFDPQLLIVVESEFWPGLLNRLCKSDIPVIVLNGKMSARSVALHARTRFVAEALRNVAVIAVQDAANAGRIRSLGVDDERICVTGSMKYDLVSSVEKVVTRIELGIADDAFVVGGSLHDGEDDVFLEAIFDPEPVVSGVTAMIAPRYPDAAPRILESAKSRGLRALLKSELDCSENHPGVFDVCVIDTLGELRYMYALADVAFVGGSLYYRGAAKGGHNLMEPAICAVPVLFGPHNYSFADIARELVQRNGGAQVRDAAELRGLLTRLHRDPSLAVSMGEAARSVVLAGQGATALNLDLVRGLLEQGRH